MKRLLTTAILLFFLSLCTNSIACPIDLQWDQLIKDKKYNEALIYLDNNEKQIVQNFSQFCFNYFKAETYYKLGQVEKSFAVLKPAIDSNSYSERDKRESLKAVFYAIELAESYFAENKFDESYEVANWATLRGNYPSGDYYEDNIKVEYVARLAELMGDLYVKKGNNNYAKIFYTVFDKSRYSSEITNKIAFTNGELPNYKVLNKTYSQPIIIEKSNNSEQKPISDLESVSNFLDSISIEKIKKETQPQFPTSHFQPNYIADQEDTSSLDGKDAVRSQNGYDDYVDLRFEASILNWGLGKTKEVNPEKALELCNEAIRIFPNLHRAYIDRAQANYKLGNATAAQNDFDKARQLAPFESKWIDKAKAKVEGRIYVDPDRVNTSYEYKAPTDLYNSTNSESQQAELKRQNAQAERTAKCLCCIGIGQQEIKGMYLGSKTYSVTPVNGLGISHNETVAQYGPSTYVSCRCCH